MVGVQNTVELHFNKKNQEEKIYVTQRPAQTRELKGVQKIVCFFFEFV